MVAKCAENCGCGTCEQNARIEQNMDDNLEYALATGDFDLFMDIFEDRDPFEFM
jgi:hypothetical protein